MTVGVVKIESGVQRVDMTSTPVYAGAIYIHAGIRQLQLPQLRVGCQEPGQPAAAATDFKNSCTSL